MAEIADIKNLQDLLKGDLKPNEEVVGSEVSRLTAPGENYGSVMLSIVVKIKDTKSGSERSLYTVGKTMPDSEKVQEVFNTQVTFKNEYAYYAIIVPVLDKFLKSKGLDEGADFAAPYYGGRLNLDGSERVDEDAIILMANLRREGYTSGGKKTEGVDSDSAKVVLDALAKYHASSIALRLQDPNTFERALKPYFLRFIPDSHVVEGIFNTVVHTLESSGFKKQDVDRVKAVWKKDFRNENVSDLWGTMIHCDSWTNNLLVKYEESKPVHCVLVDFQVFDYGTPLNDVMFFLFTSIQETIEGKMDDFLQYYYKRLTDNLQKLGEDISKFTKASFDAEVKIAVNNYEFVHAMWMLLPLMNTEITSVEHATSFSFLKISDEHIRKIKFLVKFCLEKGWL